jgi:hypothetical protein
MQSPMPLTTGTSIALVGLVVDRLAAVAEHGAKHLATGSVADGEAQAQGRAARRSRRRSVGILVDQEVDAPWRYTVIGRALCLSTG